MINVLELTKRQTLIASAITVAVGLAVIVGLGVFVAAQSNEAKQAFGSQPVSQTRKQDAKEVKTNEDGSKTETVSENETVITYTPTQPSKQAPATTKQAEPLQPTPQHDPVTAQPAQPQPCDYEGCRPPIDVSTLNERVCYIGIAVQDIELRTACGKGLGIWATMNEAIAWLNINGWQ